ncbi:cation diffusion facilitator family transporter [Eubacterium xylanophilum]|uniref:cation diffusion facilitator family transporter n=1 Tax=Eubacterium xylanophilum TaxID=39497 RepID=UPI00047C08C9|nr:cation diffusion facilitator family transporter [Eubacterium xylanophilum]
MDREERIIKTSMIGILTNVLLAGFKAFIGIVSNSIAVTMDAINNLSDAISSIITIVGTKLASRKPDKEHPLGHGRIEYIAATLVAMIIIYAGITSAIESVKKIIKPEKPEYSMVSIVIIAVAVVVKFVLGRYVKSIGEKVKSSALIDSGMDALFDSIISTSVLVSAIIFIIAGISLEAYVGLIIAIVIIKSGFDMVIDTVNDIIGKRVSAELSSKVKDILVREEEVRGAYDLLVTNYGPDRNYASVHLELPDTMTVNELDLLTRKVQRNVFKETGVVLTGISVYSYNTQNEDVVNLRAEIEKFVLAYDWALEFHGFFVDEQRKEIRFDVVTNFDISSKDALRILYSDMGKNYPKYTFEIVIDLDLSD